jgi:hypothetical protein
MNCIRCGRRLTNPPRAGMGPKCAEAAFGPVPKKGQTFKPKKQKLTAPDTDTADLFAAELESAARFYEVVDGLSLELRA